ncbi:MAG: sodium:solute symporter family protein [Lachnospiraceae bacterium]|nr:sodium:solute symporter family protein [Lachnospiraceae bacterium]
MLYGIVIYIIFMTSISIYDFFKVKNFEEYTVAGKNQKFFPVFLSLMASMIGASATIGMTDRAVEVGFPAFWWLGVGAMGLIFQSVLLSEKIRSLNANTLPDIAMKTVGKEAKTLLALIIAVSWVGIIAAQFASIVKLLTVAFDNTSTKLVTIIIAAIVIIYTLFGGQTSVIKTDKVQSLIIAVGIIVTFLYVIVSKQGSGETIITHIELLNEDVSVFDVVNLLFIVGGTYFLGPDIISRNLISKDGKTAKKAAFCAGVGLFVFSIIITMIGLWAKGNITDLNGCNPLIYIMKNYIPLPVEILLCVALIATLVSSADTCLINAATIVENDLLGKKSVKEVRIIVLIIGVISAVIAIFKTNIIELLTGAYSIYSPGIVIPLFVAIICHDRRKICKALWYWGVIVGSLIGVLNTYLGLNVEYLPLVAMGISAVFSVLSVLVPNYKKIES